MSYRDSAISQMVAPYQTRPVHLGGVLQIMVTRACDKSCFSCTQGSNLAGKPMIMTPDQYAQALESLRGYFGVVGMFGGNPAMHPQFEELCKILRDSWVPWHQRGIWCNHPRGKIKTIAETFHPEHSNLNVHMDREFASRCDPCPWLRDRLARHGEYDLLHHAGSHSSPTRWKHRTSTKPSDRASATHSGENTASCCCVSMHLAASSMAVAARPRPSRL